MTKTQFNLSEAARITRKSRTTLRKYLKRGKLSKVQGRDDRVLIDAAELTRVFGNDLDFHLAETADNGPEKVASSKSAYTDHPTQAEIELLREQLEREISQRNWERDRHTDQMQQLHEALKRAQEEHSNATRLLEDRTNGKSEWQTTIRGLESRMANHEKQFNRQREELRVLKEKHSRYKTALAKEREKLAAEQNKPWLRRLLGV